RAIVRSGEARSGWHGRATLELGNRHRLATGALDFDETHGAFAAGDRQVLVEDGAGHATPLALGRAQNLDARSRGLEPSAGKRREAAAVVVHGEPRPRPVDARLGLLDLACVSNALFGLRR